MTTAIYSEDFATIIDPTAGSFKDLLDHVAGDFSDDFDLDEAVGDYVDELNEAVRPLGVDVTVSGMATCDADADIDREQVEEAARGVDAYEVLQRHEAARA